MPSLPDCVSESRVHIPEGNLIRLAGQMPPVLPDTLGQGPGNEARLGQEEQEPRVSLGRLLPKGLQTEGTKGQPHLEPPLWLWVMYYKAAVLCLHGILSP